MILVSLAIVNPRWSFTKQLTTASSYHVIICYDDDIDDYDHYNNFSDDDLYLSISTAAAGKVSLVERKGVLHCVVPW